MLAPSGAGDSERAMLRWTMVILLASVAIQPAMAADQAAPRHRTHRAATALAPPADDPSERLFTPTDTIVRTIRPFFSGPLLPGKSGLPGIYGSNHSYEYQGPYYGGEYTSYWNRLPYACGVYGYC
jgi:hypothetical protein